MISKIVGLMVAAAMLVAPSGCSRLDRARSEYHEDRARDEAKKLNFGAAVDHEKKSIEARHDSKNDPLP